MLHKQTTLRAFANDQHRALGQTETKCKHILKLCDVDSAHPLSEGPIITAIFVTIYFWFSLLSWRIKSDPHRLNFPLLRGHLTKVTLISLAPSKHSSFLCTVPVCQW